MFDSEQFAMDILDAAIADYRENADFLGADSAEQIYNTLNSEYIVDIIEDIRNAFRVFSRNELDELDGLYGVL